MSRPYYDELEPNQAFESGAKKITETDLIMFASLTGISGPIFFDSNFAAKTPFASPVVPGPLTLCYAIGLTGDMTSGRVLAAVSIDNVRFLAPVHIGDVVRVTSTVIAKKDSRSKPGTGLVVMGHDVFNGRGEKVVHYERTLLYGSKAYLSDSENRAS
jgi:acyl dehydratase